MSNVRGHTIFTVFTDCPKYYDRACQSKGCAYNNELRPLMLIENVFLVKDSPWSQLVLQLEFVQLYKLVP